MLPRCSRTASASAAISWSAPTASAPRCARLYGGAAALRRVRGMAWPRGRERVSARDPPRGSSQCYAMCLPEGEMMLTYPVPGRDNDTRPGRRCYNLMWYRPTDYYRTLPELCTDASGRCHGTSIPPPLLRPDIGAKVRPTRTSAARAADRHARRAHRTALFPGDLRPRIAAHGARARRAGRRRRLRRAPARGRGGDQGGARRRGARARGSPPAPTSKARSRPTIAAAGLSARGSSPVGGVSARISKPGSSRSRNAPSRSASRRRNFCCARSAPSAAVAGVDGAVAPCPPSTSSRRSTSRK